MWWSVDDNREITEIAWCVNCMPEHVDAARPCHVANIIHAMPILLLLIRIIITYIKFCHYYK